MRDSYLESKCSILEDSLYLFDIPWTKHKM